MRRRVSLAISVLALVLASPGPGAAPALGRAAGVATAPASAVPGQVACRITDPRVTEVSGLVTIGTGYVAINDSNVQRSRVKIFFLTKSCALSRSVSYPTNPLDPEDLAVARDGTLWVADIGDNSPLTGGNGTRRASIALWSLAPNATTPVIHRLVYPDGRPRDAETLLLNGDGTPVIVTKEPAGEVYVVDGPLRANNTVGVPLRRVGTFRTSSTGTSNPLGFIGAGLVTGGAVAPDGGRAVVRTMSDAYEFAVSGGDVAKAIATGTPRITALPNEPQGEAISYTPDGRYYVTGSDQTTASAILRYAAPPDAPATKSTPSRGTAVGAAEGSDSAGWSMRKLAWVLAGFGGLGILLVVVGVTGVLRGRRVSRAATRR